MWISIHASHAGCDALVSDQVSLLVPMISIHASHAGCDPGSRSPGSRIPISIHASHAGCDLYRFIYPPGDPLISIHASHAGCDGD